MDPATIDVSTRGHGYTVWIALPWSELGVTPEADMTLRGDVGFIRSDATGRTNIARAYRSNKQTNLVCDPAAGSTIQP